MKKRLIIGFSIIIALFIIYSLQIPNLKVSYQNTKVEVLKCPFSWDTLFSNKRADYPTPPNLEKQINATTVEPESVLDFSFSKEPTNFEVTLWNDKPKIYKSNNNGIVLPKEKGTYLFAVIGVWKNGQVLYIFKITVK